MYKTKMSTPLRCLDAPAHYKQGEIECIDAMESALVAFGKEWLATYCTINAIAICGGATTTRTASRPT